MKTVTTALLKMETNQEQLKAKIKIGKEKKKDGCVDRFTRDGRQEEMTVKQEGMQHKVAALDSKIQGEINIINETFDDKIQILDKKIKN